MSFNLDEYVDVAERIRAFNEKYPEGSLQSHVDFVRDGVLCVAEAYREPDDPRPGVGHAFEPIPGKTPYTRDSEVMNAETSAWGRAIVALGFETKKIASKNEVQNRQYTNGDKAEQHSVKVPPDDDPITPVMLDQCIEFAEQHGTTWPKAVWILLGKAEDDSNDVTVGQARQVCADIVARKKAEATA